MRSYGHAFREFLNWWKNPFNAGVALASLIPFVIIIVFILNYRQNAPMMNQWSSSLTVALATQEGHLGLKEIFASHAGHLLIWSYIVVAISTLVNGWNLDIEIFLTPLMTFFSFLALVRLFQYERPRLYRWMMIPTVFLLAALSQDIIWQMSVASHWEITRFLFFLVVSVLYMSTPSWRSLVGGGVLALAMTFAGGNGIVVWPLILILLWFMGYRKKEYFIAWIIMTAIALFLYSRAIDITISTGGEAGETAHSFESISYYNPRGHLRFFLIYLGNIFTMHSFRFATLTAVIGLGLFAGNGFYIWTKERSFERLIVPLALAGYSVSSGVMTSLGRLKELNDIYLTQATSSHYPMMGTPFWVALVMLMVVTINYLWRELYPTTSPPQGDENLNQAVLTPGYAPSRQKVWLLRANLFAIPILVIFFLTAELGMAQKFGMDNGFYLGLRPDGLLSHERCVYNYPVTGQDNCLNALEKSAGEERFYQIAANRLTIFAENDPISVLPDAYQSGSPVIVHSALHWRSLFVQEWMLADVSPDLIFNFTALEGVYQGVDRFPHPLQNLYAYPDEAALQALTAFVGDSEQVWYLRDKESQTTEPLIFEQLRSLGYLPTVIPLTDDYYKKSMFTLVRYQKAPTDMADLLVFNNMVSLLHWQTNTNMPFHACDEIMVQSWWQVTQPADANYAFQFSLLDSVGTEVTRWNGELAAIPMMLWIPEMPTLDERTLTIPCDVPAGDYVVQVGIYHYETGEFLPITLPESDKSGVVETWQIQ